jgi:hypothetical protein
MRVTEGGSSPRMGLAMMFPCDSSKAGGSPVVELEQWVTKERAAFCATRQRLGMALAGDKGRCPADNGRRGQAGGVAARAAGANKRGEAIDAHAPAIVLAFKSTKPVK